MTARSGCGFATFSTQRAVDADRADDLVARLTRELGERVHRIPSLLSSRVHISLDRTTVVRRELWTSESDYRTCAGRDDVLTKGAPRPMTFEGIPASGIDGPAAAETPGFVAIATRHISGHESAGAVVDLLRHTGEWKRYSPGFISATPYISLDGMTYVNYPQWVDEAAYDRYMADTRIAEGRNAIARWEVSPPEFVLCTVVANAGSR